MMNLENECSSPIQIYSGGFYYPDDNNRIHKESKHFVFDLDETLGSFSELRVLWMGIAQLFEEDTGEPFVESQEYMNQLLDLYPEFLRYGIITILEFLYYKKTKGQCGNVYLYTNNVFSKSWTTMIIHFIETKGKMKGLFDQIIGAFKINRVISEPKRTTATKTVQDLIRCTLLPTKSAEICFIDNTYFPRMKGSRVFYIQPKAYFHSLSINEIIRRFIGSSFIANIGGRGLGQKIDGSSWDKRLYDWFIDHGYFVGPRIKSKHEKELDIQVSKKLMYHIKEFFYLAIYRPRTQKIRGKYWYNITKKNRK